MIPKTPGGPWAMLAIAVFLAALVAALWSGRIPLSSDLPRPESSGPVHGKSRFREMASDTHAARKRAADPKFVQQWLDELLERHPEAEPGKRDVPDHENGHLAWVEFSEETMEEIELPECVSHYVTDPTLENRKCAEEWLDHHKHIRDALVAIGAIRQQAMGDHRFDMTSTPGVNNISNAFYMLLASGLIAAEDGNEPLARSTFASAMGLVRHMEGIEASSLIARVIATGSRTVIYQKFLDRIYPMIANDADRLAVWRDTLSPGDTRDGMARALIGDNLRIAKLFISSAYSGEFDSLIEINANDAETQLLINAQFEVNARAIAAMKSGSALDSIPSIYAQPVETRGMSGESRNFFIEQMESSQSAMTAILKKETHLMMYDAALAAALGVAIPYDPVSGKPFLWDKSTKTLSAPEGTTPQKPLSLPIKN
ncbi:MAG: hypothetical protein MUF86_08660 [Akkermansiaceae bacterium]|jgi:hypothetical protein|nr:hypothetical protein [Akkermansiaceae bacterium]